MVVNVDLWRLKNKPYWIQLDAESQTNWKNDSHTGYKAGFLLGHMKKGRGLWIKFEVGMGPHSCGDLRHQYEYR